MSASLFFFAINEDENAVNALFFGFYLTISAVFFLRILLYFRYKATLNEFYFFLVGNIIPIAIIALEQYIPLGDEKILSMDINTTLGPSLLPSSLTIGIMSVLAFPYLLISTTLLIRSFTRYKFIRLTPHSERGPSAEFTAILTFFVFGVLLIYVGELSEDLIGILYGIFYIFSGLGFLFGR